MPSGIPWYAIVDARTPHPMKKLLEWYALRSARSAGWRMRLTHLGSVDMPRRRYLMQCRAATLRRRMRSRRSALTGLSTSVHALRNHICFLNDTRRLFQSTAACHHRLTIELTTRARRKAMTVPNQAVASLERMKSSGM